MRIFFMNKHLKFFFFLIKFFLIKKKKKKKILKKTLFLIQKQKIEIFLS